jgi:hypothetical protein
MIDSREKCPILFPPMIELPVTPQRTITVPLTTSRQKLDSGDYSLTIDGLSYAETVVIERKGSLLELASNLMGGTDTDRQHRAFDRLSRSCAYPTLLIEVPLHDFLVPKPGHTLSLPLLFHRLVVASLHYNLRLLWVPKPQSLTARRLLGNFILSYLWTVIIYDSKKKNLSNPQTVPDVS